jgi:predicted amidohydrolase
MQGEYFPQPVYLYNMSTLTITTIQTNLHWENKQANLDMLEKKINSIKERTEVVVLPEMFSTGFSMRAAELGETMEGETVQWMKKMAASKKIILTGSVIIEEQGKYFNRLIWMLPNGQYGIYDKRHCFAYAGEDKYFTPGTTRLIASVNGWKIHLLICYDLRFPVWARQATPPELRSQPSPAKRERLPPEGKGAIEYDILIYVANWPERRIQAWKTLLAARAIENQSFVVGVNRTGDDGNGIHYTGESMVIDAMGEPLYHKKDEEDIYTVTLDKEDLQSIRTKLPFLRDADGFEIKT